MSAMDPAALAIFAAALFVAAAAPGPTTTTLVARVLARGTAGALAFVVGLSVGEVIWLTAAVLGLALIAKTFALAFMALKYVGALYLAYLAWRMWASASDAPEESTPKAERPLRLFVAAISLTLGNPKIMVFYLALLPNLIALERVTALGYVELVAVTVAVLSVVDGTYVLMASRVGKLLRRPSALRWIRRGSGALLAGAAVAVASR